MVRKGLGGGMRQAGILAAAGLIALEQMPHRLHEDHANARLLAQALSSIEGIGISPAEVETNIVIFSTQGDAPSLVAAMRERGVLASAIGPNSIRLVTHRDVDTAACRRAAEAIQSVAVEQLATA